MADTLQGKQCYEGNVI